MQEPIDWTTYTVTITYTTIGLNLFVEEADQEVTQIVATDKCLTSGLDKVPNNGHLDYEHILGSQPHDIFFPEITNE